MIFSLLGLGMTDIRIRPRIFDNVFYSTFFITFLHIWLLCLR